MIAVMQVIGVIRDLIDQLIAFVQGLCAPIFSTIQELFQVQDLSGPATHQPIEPVATDIAEAESTAFMTPLQIAFTLMLLAIAIFCIVIYQQQRYENERKAEALQEQISHEKVGGNVEKIAKNESMFGVNPDLPKFEREEKEEGADDGDKGEKGKEEL